MRESGFSPRCSVILRMMARPSFMEPEGSSTGQSSGVFKPPSNKNQVCSAIQSLKKDSFNLKMTKWF
jgi:hypothetical protein